MKYRVIFHTFSGVLALEKFMKKHDISYETMPAPRALSVDCGVALVFDYDYNFVIEHASTNNIHRIYDMDDHMVYENE